MAGKKVYRYPHPILPAEYSEEANRYPDGEEGVWYDAAYALFVRVLVDRAARDGIVWDESKIEAL